MKTIKKRQYAAKYIKELSFVPCTRNALTGWTREYDVSIRERRFAYQLESCARMLVNLEPFVWEGVLPPVSTKLWQELRIK
jgi:hypothetical protein